MAEIEAPEVDQQMSQARASLEQARAALEQSLANYEQGKSNLELARVTAQRWNSLVAEGIVPRQENDQYQAQFQSQTAGVQALEKAVAAQRSNVAAAEANLAALDQVQSYRVVKAPFDGLVTLRNVDVGALVNAGSTLLFRIAQTGTLLYLRQRPADQCQFHPNWPAGFIENLHSARTQFPGTVARTANSLDPASRTMLVEIRVPESEWCVAARHVRTGRPEQPSDKPAPADSRRFSNCSFRRNPGCRGPFRSYRAPPEDSGGPRLRG